MSLRRDLAFEVMRCQIARLLYGDERKVSGVTAMRWMWSGDGASWNYAVLDGAWQLVWQWL